MADKTTNDERKKRLSCYASRGPGPVYMLPPTIGMVNHDKTKKQAPAYSLGLKLKTEMKGDPKSPGPAYNIQKGLTAKGPYTSPAYSLRGRTKIFGVANDGPGPAAYNPPVNVNRSAPPAYTLRARTKIIEAGYFSPGPIYTLPPALGPKVPDKPAAAECSIKGRWKARKSMTEGGAYYDIGRPDLVRPRAGQASLKGRPKEKFLTYAAGPATYNLQNAINKVRNTPPAYSLGIRHSECSGVYYTKQDKDDCGCNDMAESSRSCSGGACPCTA